MLLSSFLGVTLALTYGVASVLINKRALQASSQQLFMAMVVGGMLARLFFVFCILLIGMLLLPLEQTAFVISFLLAFIPMLAYEVFTLHRSANSFSGEMSTR